MALQSLASASVGYRHFDTASLYGTEHAIGSALSEAFKTGLVKREEVFVSSKLWSNSHAPEDVRPALQASLGALQLSYIDLYIIHWPVKFKEFPVFPDKNGFLPLDIKATWQTLERCVDEGLAKAIGVSNFSSKKLQDLLTYARIRPSVDQVEYHPFWQQKKLRDFCNSVGVHLSGYSPLGSPGMAVGSTELLNHPTMIEIGKKHGRSPAQVILRWGIEQGVSLLPKSYSPARIEHNFDIWGFKLTEEDHELISKFDQRKFWRGERWCNPETGPFTSVEDLWDGEI